MKTPRLKQIRKLVGRLNKIGYRTPYNIIAEHEFLVAFSKSQMSPKVLEHMMGGPIRMWTTSCEYKKYKEIIKDTRLIGRVGLKKCNHKEEPTTEECLGTHLVENNKHHYFVGVSPKYREMKDRNGVPVLFLRAGVLFLEVGDTSQEKMEKTEEPKGLPPAERKILEALLNK